MERKYSIYDTKTHLSRLLRQVKGGNEIIISDRGTPIAKIIPFPVKSSFEEIILSLTARGHVVPRTEKSLPRGIKKAGGLKRFLKDRE